MLSLFCWALGYYVLAVLLGGLLFWVGSPMYTGPDRVHADGYPWPYFKVLLLPIVGLVLFIMLWVGDLQDWTARYSEK